LRASLERNVLGNGISKQPLPSLLSAEVRLNLKNLPMSTPELVILPHNLLESIHGLLELLGGIFGLGLVEVLLSLSELLPKSIDLRLSLFLSFSFSLSLGINQSLTQGLIISLIPNVFPKVHELTGHVVKIWDNITPVSVNTPGNVGANKIDLTTLQSKDVDSIVELLTPDLVKRPFYPPLKGYLREIAFEM